jgi:hypothetical protein
MWVLHFPLPWKIMVCKKNEDIMFLQSLMIVVLLTIKHDNAIWQRGEEHLKHVSNETCSNVRNCKMTMMPSLTLRKNVTTKEQHGGTQLQYIFGF